MQYAALRRRRTIPNPTRAVPSSASEARSGTDGITAWKFSAVIVTKSRLPTDVENVAGATLGVPIVNGKAVLSWYVSNTAFVVASTAIAGN
jgi:hypothetical protein